MNKRSISLLFTMLMMAGCSKSNNTPQPQPGGHSFLIFDGIHYANKPDLQPEGLLPLNLVYANRLVSPNPADNTQFLPDTVKIKAVATQYLTQPNVPVTLDIESWSYATNALPATISKFKQVVNTFKNINPAVKLGFYGVVPNDRYDWNNIQPVGGSNYLQWQRLNDAMIPVAQSVDLFFPAVYTFDTDTTAWKQFTAASIREARRYAPGKPVYAYIWPQYHDGTPLSLQFVDPVIWRCELETLYQLADGCVIWSGNKGVNGTIQWSNDMPWWQETRNFIARHQLH
ncbi:hyaluronidase [Chitinophaga niastensis]|uniref:Hyaluronidase n=1 Tax=Chitinophaga niastensis TaxID=536980 RepID=A0A2P8HCQ5_CHINA|nr:hypothetical protein [Chitinophaga niastensis]PSL43891.1 hyaluronidase [Chitinophaga niastensis]